MPSISDFSRPSTCDFIVCSGLQFLICLRHKKKKTKADLTPSASQENIKDSAKRHVDYHDKLRGLQTLDTTLKRLQGSESFPGYALRP
ncbi:hypothetical protein L2E82_05052 [Cichorium intybus]|uniref:Uncharacterized protein n=1 Tax=Cichorium intybus TaxID=13427 RepID=A0ACB9H6F7_CICIN|nr:hypothetical protein L2E82_05052 [Cichorium intybus]